MTEQGWNDPHERAAGAVSKSSRGRLEQSAALLAPLALLLGLALAGGGFELAQRHIAGLAVWLTVVALLVFGVAGQARLGRPFYWVGGLLAGLALLSAMSSLWSGSVELSVIEADRVLVYLGIFLAAFLIAQTDERRQRFAEGLTIAIVAIAILALISRLLPDLGVGSAVDDGAQLRYPLGYWNANGIVFGTGFALLLWTCRNAVGAWLRWLSAAAMPVLLLALYLTYSRGGVVALALGAGCVIALSRDRLWLLATAGAGAVGALPALLAVQSNRAVAENLTDRAGGDEGLTILLLLLAGAALAAALFAGLNRLERRRGALTGRAVSASRDPRLLRAIALAGAVAAIVALIAVGGRAWEQFTSTDIQDPTRAEEHLLDLSGAGRGDFYRVAIDGFGERPVLGTGAGTYQFIWEQHRSIDTPLHDAHSVYLEAFAELGLLGGGLVIALVAAILWFGIGAWRHAPHPQRELHAALLAAALAFAVGAGLDWFWEIAAVGAIFFLAAGALVAARCSQLAPPTASALSEPEGGRFGVTVGGIAIAWIAAIALIGPLLVDREITASQDAARAGDLAAAAEHAETARSIEPFAASPYVQLGLIAQEQGEWAEAIERYTQAIDREERNWQLYYLRSKVEASAGNEAGARSDLQRARELNPRAPELQAGPR